MRLTEKKQRNGRIYDFSKAALLSCSLMLGCGGTVHALRSETPRPDAVSPLRVSCDQFNLAASQGQEMFFGITERAGYRFRINNLTNDRVNADVRIPISISDGNAFVYLMPGFDGVEFSRQNFQSVIETVCDQVSVTRRRIDGVSRYVITADFRMPSMTNAKLAPEVIPAVTPPVRRTPSVPNLGGIISMMLQGGAINVALIHVARMQGGIVSAELEPGMFRVASSDSHTVSLTVEGGQFRGRTFRLDRSIEFGFEVLRSDNYISIPVRIEQLGAGDGRFMILIGPDCARSMHLHFGMEIFDGAHPDCR
jgi:hypothetical protein